jgi:hypothetical protein
MVWFFPTQSFRLMQGQREGETGIDNTMAERGFKGSAPGSWDGTCSVR